MHNLHDPLVRRLNKLKSNILVKRPGYILRRHVQVIEKKEIQYTAVTVSYLAAAALLLVLFSFLTGTVFFD